MTTMSGTSAPQPQRAEPTCPRTLRESWDGHQCLNTNETTTLASRRMSNGVVKRQRRRQSGIAAAAGNTKQKAFATALAESLLAQIYSSKPRTTSVQISREEQQFSAETMDSMPASVAHHRNSFERGDPCSFRTRLLDGDRFASEDVLTHTNDLGIGGIKFDDAECISIDRSLGRFGNQVRKRPECRIHLAPADLISPSVSEDDFRTDKKSGVVRDRHLLKSPQSDQSPLPSSTVSTSMSTINMDESTHEAYPFWPLPPRRKKHRNFPSRDRDVDSNNNTTADTDNVSDDNGDDDDISIISDVSLIPTYALNDIARKRQCARAHALLRQLIKAKTNTTKQTVRILKRTCLAMGQAWVDPNPYKPAKCVSVGKAY
ncbi:hypothetical protein QBC35DRAFT_197367 [Podospora australis]|uniref:Uncharacterized protein n=1 Tax=Podospora australis TaxID=1536484 RepID=A0AAN7AL16_9PEZI|nr:hypothetical protein QBC35DRAFT_197367 [Podospora australis]